MEEGREERGREEEEEGREPGRQAIGRDNFRMYYALGPELERESSVETGETGEESGEEDEGEEQWRRRLEQEREQLDRERKQWRKSLVEGELSDDSGVKDGYESEEEEEEEDRTEKQWAGGSVPPDLVASVHHLRVVREEPRRTHTGLARVHGMGGKDSSNNSTNNMVEQDVTDYRRRQVEAYTNLEDLLDVPWEESDLAPPSKVDVVLRVGGELGQRYRPTGLGLGSRRTIIQQAGQGLDPGQCGMLCNNCTIM